MDSLQDALRRRGAVWGELFGQPMPARFGELEREWRAARDSAAVLPAGFRCLIAASGEDTAVFLHGMLSNDIKGLVPGSGAYTALLTQSGKLVADLRVYREEKRILLDTLAHRRPAVIEALDRLIVADDVELTAPAENPLLILEGPHCEPTLSRILGPLPDDRAPHRHWRAGFEGMSVSVMQVSELRGRGFMLCGPADLGAPLFEAACSAGAVPVGTEVLDILRVESGVPWYGRDMSENDLVMEIGLNEALSFTKGCYLGQEVVERIAARGHVNRRLMGLLVDGELVPPRGARLLADGREVGLVTSAVRSLLLDRVIALGYVHRSHASEGARVEVQIAGGSAGATVVVPPFHKLATGT